MELSRRDLTRLLGLGGVAALLPRPAQATFNPAQADTEAFWEGVRGQFLMPRSLLMFNAANLCPSSQRVIDTLERSSREIDRDPSPANRAKLGQGREETRRALAAFLRATPEDIVLTRNTSEANNIVSSGLGLKQGDEVLLFADNHPSNNNAWAEKAKRAGFSIKTLPQPHPHPGTDVYVDTVAKAIGPSTRILAFTHVTSTVGDMMPARELCRLARERGVLSLVDGAQSFGVLDVDLSAMQPDFYTGSAHKWPCGARENGVLYVNPAAQDRVAASVVSLYGGAVGVSRRLEAHGQRDEAAMIAFGEAIRVQTEIGIARIEARVRLLTQQLMQGLQAIPGGRLFTSTDPARSGAIVTFQAGTQPANTLITALYQKHGVICASASGAARGGLRFSPHFYNTRREVDMLVAAVKGLAGG
jgi:selenocysteine lyase/cysteine desulfurase